MKSKLILFFLFSAIGSASLFAQSSVRGRVIDENNFPLPGAVITIEDGQKIVSDFDGYFVALIEGTKNAAVSYTGFAFQEFSLSEGSNTVSIIILKPEVNALDEVVVSGFQSGVVKSLNKQKNDVNVTNVVSSFIW